ncbi:MAG: phosphoglycerate mutase [Candidatus Parcubacteria bacterium]|nr:MAG: phosphoglycerate mutase [Candidatus Parcubacteria bacterium]
MRKIIFILIDGLADIATKNTPLRLASKIFLDSLKGRIHLSYIYPLKKEYWPKGGNYSVSGLANFHLLGYKLKIKQFKRGPYEAIGSNIKFKNGWLAFRVNFATVDEKSYVIDRRAGRNIYGLEKLTKEINSIKFKIPFELYHIAGHRGVLIFKTKLSENISENDPYKTNLRIKKIKPSKKDYLSKKTAELINNFLEIAYEKIKISKINLERQKRNILPANYLLIREPGNKILKLKNFFRKYSFKNGLIIATNGVDKGTCLSVGFKKYDLNYPNSIINELNNLTKAIFNLGDKYQLLYCHLKKADELSHDKNFNGKKEFFEKFDDFLKKIFAKFKNDIFVITGDHITNTQSGEHMFGPVPLIIINSNLINKPKEISEIEAIKLGEYFKNTNDLWKFLKQNVS